MFKKETILFIILAGFFVTNALVAEFIGVKIFAFEATFGFDPLNWNLFGKTGTLDLTAGVLLWPVVFIMTDLINEYYGRKGVRILSFMTAGLIAYAFMMVFGAIGLEPASWWTGSFEKQGVQDAQVSYAAIFGQSNWIVVGSLVAFLMGQILDVSVFHWIRKLTGGRYLWLRANGSTLVSQIVDSFLVLYIAFVLNPGTNWDTATWLSVGTVNLIYKFTAAVVLTPLLYLVHGAIDRYLGKERSLKLREEAAAS
ncbi:MAG: queuosine precursor transporter [Bacteroidia bacterium]